MKLQARPLSKRDQISIIGAGPAGLAAGIVLAKGGYPVTIYEKQAAVGTRFNGDFQGIENWSVKNDSLDEFADMGIDIALSSRPIRRATVYNPGFHAKEFVTDKPMFYLVKRGNGEGTLDSALKEQAVEAGVSFQFSTSASTEDADIVASGPRIASAVAAGMTFETKRSDGVLVIANNKLAPKGYAYLLVGDGQATLATVLFEQFTAAKNCLTLALDRFSRLVDLGIQSAPRTWGGYGSFRVPKTAVQDTRLYVGEAAGFQDFLFGFGIRHAILSGCLAAKSILDGSNYDQLWKNRLLPFLKASASNRYLFSRFGNAASYCLWTAASLSPNPISFMRWLYSWTFSRKLIYPFAKRRYGGA